MKRTSLTHQFVEYIPSELADGVLYISITYSTAVHKCVCGCSNKVVTPITPADWQLSYNGDAVSLTPSIGNCGFPCRSHYWIDAGRVRWARRWTDDQIAAGRARADQGAPSTSPNAPPTPRALGRPKRRPPPLRGSAACDTRSGGAGAAPWAGAAGPARGPAPRRRCGPSG
jgi:Family of unknown function (DUF6527)